jgi:hypothetical protein
MSRQEDIILNHAALLIPGLTGQENATYAQ